MNTLISINPSEMLFQKSSTGKIPVLVDTFMLERIASSLGLISSECKVSIARAEKDVRQGRVRTAKSLAELG
jgi:hypothetical protein